MSGLIVDYYDRVAVIQTHSLGMHLSLDRVVHGLQQALPELKAVYNKSAKVLRKSGQTDVEDGFIFGALPEDHGSPPSVAESSYIDLEQGQKTGFFIDQRENRTLLRTLAEGKRVLNVFSYTGGFSIAAMQGGAQHVASLDSSRRALDLAEEAVGLMTSTPTHESIEADALAFLKNGVSDYDIVVLDPPAFAKSASARHAAVQGYKRINQRTLETIKPGGILFTFSCSQAVDDRLFTHTVIAAAIQAKRTVRILHRLHQPPDHPVSAFHPEGSYLKGLVLRVD